jgi:hypothetical protein
VKRLGPEHWRTAEAQVVLAKCLIALGDYDKAAQPLKEGIEALQKFTKSHPSLVHEGQSASAELSRGRSR